VDNNKEKTTVSGTADPDHNNEHPATLPELRPDLPDIADGLDPPSKGGPSSPNTSRG
jgi:hypothetical protein